MVFLALMRIRLGKAALSDIALQKAVNISACLAKGGGIVDKVERSQSESLRQTFLGDIEARSKLPVLLNLVDAGPQAVDGLAKEQLRRHIERQVEKQGLQVDRPLFGHARNQIRDVAVQVSKILVLGAGELLPEKLSRVLPGRALLGGDAVSKQRREDGWTTAESVVFSPSEESSQSRDLNFRLANTTHL